MPQATKNRGVGFEIGAPGRIRTCDLSLRRGPRYPAVPPEHNGVGSGDLIAGAIIAVKT